MSYMAPLICGWEWFPNRKGMVTGITLGGYGFGSFIFSLVSTHLVNPDGVDPSIKDPNQSDITFYDTDVTSRVPYMIQTLVYIWAGLAFIGVLLITRKPSVNQDIPLVSDYATVYDDEVLAEELLRKSHTGN
jgi:OFA family oxalate/formate antiporter-like MFS transporter